jgi:uridylate kinase
MQTTIISVGGSMIIPEEINIEFLKELKQITLCHIKNNNRVILVCGGGKIARDYIDASRKLAKITDINADLVGIAATKLNAELVRVIFEDTTYEKVVYNPTKKIETNKKVIIASGWEPGCSTDTDAVLLAKNFNADTIINMTNIDYVYNKDPKKHKDVTPLKDISWEDFQKIVGEEWSPGLNMPFDPIATKHAKELNLKVIIINGNNLENLSNYLEQKEFKGTTIHK